MKDQLVNPDAFLRKVTPECNEEYPWTDLGDGRLFANCYREIIRYIPERKCWYVYSNGIWQEDMGSLKVMGLCKEFACALKTYCKTIKAEETQKHYLEHSKRWQRRSGRETVLKDAQDICETSII